MQTPAVVSSEFKSHFPVIVLQRDHQQVDELNNNLAAFILALEQKFRDTQDNAAKSPSIATEGAIKHPRGQIFLA